ncbi:CBS domain-containing protein [Archaeoglobus neptunius]|uniref:CBS domain-containing protein n=1 Tax=Archaeoglobus neptunius TaxID=2798580 RepID=UPI00192825EB|nr:CBS domain-containing protein [Archaeoglobus neptunius]
MQSDIPVKEVMTTVVCTVKMTDSVHNLAKKLVEYGVGSAVVLDNGLPVGIVTEKDLISKIVARNKVPSEVIVEEVMSQPVITINPNTSLREAARIMMKRGIRRLPVVNNSGELIGIITDNDILSVSLDLGEFASLITQDAIGYSSQVVEGPVIEEEEDTGGICDKCGKYTDKLYSYNGLRLCEDCADAEK